MDSSAFTNLTILADATTLSEFEKQYILLRAKENRLYSNEEVKQLPNIADSNPHYKEWILRRRSAQKLLRYLKLKNTSLNILEVGCGNGWLSNYLTQISNAKLTGYDINFAELQQAAVVFADNNKLHFIYGNGNLRCIDKTFDVIVFAASLQYFSSPADIIKQALMLLNKHGEIHIIDTPFYNSNNVDAAKKRSQDYYSSLGFVQMSNYYYHHQLKELQQFNYKLLHNPQSFFNRLKKNKSAFPWIVIKEGLKN